MNALAITNPVNLQKRLAVALIFAALTLIAGYLYFLSASVMQVVLRSQSVQDITQLRSETSNLETKYIAAQHSLSAEIASRDGYTKIDKKIFIDRGAPSQSLSFNTQ